MASFTKLEVRPGDSSGNEIFGYFLLGVTSHCSEKKLIIFGTPYHSELRKLEIYF